MQELPSWSECVSEYACSRRHVAVASSSRGDGDLESWIAEIEEGWKLIRRGGCIWEIISTIFETSKGCWGAIEWKRGKERKFREWRICDIYIYISLFVAYLATDFCMERVRHFCTRMSPFYIHFICIITFLGTLLKYKYENAKKA